MRGPTPKGDQHGPDDRAEHEHPAEPDENVDAGARDNGADQEHNEQDHIGP